MIKFLFKEFNEKVKENKKQADEIKKISNKFCSFLNENKNIKFKKPLTTNILLKLGKNV